MTTCPICIEKVTDDIYVTFCSHIFHSKCINASLDIDIRCPMCRRDISNTKSKNHMRIKKESVNGHKWTETVNTNGKIISSVPIWI